MVRLLNISQLSTELSRETGSPGQTLWSHYKSWETLISHFPHCHVNLYHWYSQLVLQDIEFYQTLVIRWAMTDIYRLKLASNLDRNIDKTPKVMSKLNPLQFPECWKHQDIITSTETGSDLKRKKNCYSFRSIESFRVYPLTNIFI